MLSLPLPIRPEHHLASLQACVAAHCSAPAPPSSALLTNRPSHQRPSLAEEWKECASSEAAAAAVISPPPQQLLLSPKKARSGVAPWSLVAPLTDASLQSQSSVSPPPLPPSSAAAAAAAAAMQSPAAAATNAAHASGCGSATLLATHSVRKQLAAFDAESRRLYWLCQFFAQANTFVCEEKIHAALSTGKYD